MVIGYRDVLGITLYIYCSVAFLLVAGGTQTAVESVYVVYPGMAVLRVQRDTVVQSGHDGKIAQLQTLRLARQNTESANHGVSAHTLYGDIHRHSYFAFDLEPFLGAAHRIQMLRFNGTEQTDC